MLQVEDDEVIRTPCSTGPIIPDCLQCHRGGERGSRSSPAQFQMARMSLHLPGNGDPTNKVCIPKQYTSHTGVSRAKQKDI